MNDPVWNAWLKALGIPQSEIQKVVVQFDPQPLVNGEVDGWFSFITNEPNLLKVQGVDTVTILLNDNKYPLVSETYIVRKDTLKSDRDKIKAILTAANKGWKDNIVDPTLGAKYTVEIYGKDLGLTQAEQELESRAESALIYTEDSKTNGLFTITDTLVEETIATLALGDIKISKEQLFDLSIVNELYQEKPELKAPVTPG